MIYVLGSPDRKFVKIGFSKKRPVERCEQIEDAHPSPLVLMLVLRGDKSVERHFHQRFNALRARREWFQKAREIEEWLRTDHGVITRPFYEWLLLRRGDASPIGTFARDALEDVSFPKEAMTYLSVEDHLRDRGISWETRELFDLAWRDFLRYEVRRALATVVADDVGGGSAAVPVDDVRAGRLRSTRSEHSRRHAKSGLGCGSLCHG